MRATTVLGVRRGGQVALAGDGQVTQGDVVLKHGARKIRTLADGRALAGFAGAVADGLTLIGKFESQLRTGDGNLRRAAVELAKEWRTDRYLRRLEAQLLVADTESLLLISGDGDVIEPDDGIVAIGSGSPYATAAAKALMAHTDLSARQVVEAAMAIAAEICIFTNDRVTIVSLGEETEGSESEADGGGEAEGAIEDELPMPSPLPSGMGGGGEEDEEDEAEEEEERERRDVTDVDDDELDDDDDGPGVA